MMTLIHRKKLQSTFYVVFPILKYADLFDQYFSTSLFWGMYFTFMSSWKAV